MTTTTWKQQQYDNNNNKTTTCLASHVPEQACGLLVYVGQVRVNEKQDTDSHANII